MSGHVRDRTELKQRSSRHLETFAAAAYSIYASIYAFHTPTTGKIAPTRMHVPTWEYSLAATSVSIVYNLIHVEKQGSSWHKDISNRKDAHLQADPSGKRIWHSGTQCVHFACCSLHVHAAGACGPLSMVGRKEADVRSEAAGEVALVLLRHDGVADLRPAREVLLRRGGGG